MILDRVHCFRCAVSSLSQACCFVLGCPENVKLLVSIAPVTTGSRQAVAVGTLINEFVTNSYKHAFPDQKAGTISVTIDAEANGFVHLNCRDDGVGLGHSTNAHSGGLGMQIARVICLELGADLEFEPAERGVSLKVAFAAVDTQRS